MTGITNTDEPNPAREADAGMRTLLRISYLPRQFPLAEPPSPEL